MLEAIGWNRGYPDLRSWLEEQEVWDPSSAKPHRPKTALNRTLQRTRRRRSPRLYGEIATGVSLARRQDPAFRKLKTVLQAWFRRAADV